MTYKIYTDGQLLYSTGTNDPDYEVTGITLDVEMGKAGSPTFTIPPSHPLYSSLKNLLTIITIYEDDVEIFRGRLFDTTTDFFNQKQCQGEGDLTFLSDGVVPKVEVKESIRALFTRYINEYNSRVEDYKKFTVGSITVDNADSEIVDVKYDSYRYALDAIQNDLIDSYGGYLRTRTVGNTHYIDYLKDYSTKSPQTIEFGVNLLDLSKVVSPEDIFTIFIPVGDEDLLISDVNGGKDYLEVNGGIATWGRKYKIQSFGGIDNADTLLKEAKLYIQNHYDGSPQTITLTAVDMKLLGVDVTSIHVGDSVMIVSKPHGLNKEYTCTAINYNISTPGKTQYTFGKPKQDFTKKYNQNSKDTQNSIDSTNSNLKSTRGGAAATASKLEDYIIATDQKLLLMHDNIELNGKNIEILGQKIDLTATAMNNGFNTVAINLDAMNARLDLTATKEYTDGRIDEVSINLDAANRKIAINAQDIVEINSDLTKINGDLTVLGKTITDEIESVKGDISWLNTKTITAAGINADYANFHSGLVVTGNASVTGQVVAGSLKLDGNTVRTTTLPVVTSFTQASGQTAPTTNYTFLTTGVKNGVAHQPSAGSVTNF